eukprot:2755785-Amphidinium_carterae.1
MCGVHVRATHIVASSAPQSQGRDSGGDTEAFDVAHTSELKPIVNPVRLGPAGASGVGRRGSVRLKPVLLGQGVKAREEKKHVK